ncbi:ABC transporter ATP-binding protein [Jannaschia pagri]|uniref:ABC transporter ATP-binding protein n=1 Tax=Jannaschia pagri TaxID=2829797 RepID=A0ABQ4NKW9_9RHOB|nr:MULTISPECIES: ABC transporter ATP-binding protein [unclassified Jannaschia]GIT91233.1 ABC transporter ATP-binding protein [Jannaschia sp. AI_61]GIT95065.1 ABC transporter ATP-binding protein [Jannaschia sp. AI_62]
MTAAHLSVTDLSWAPRRGGDTLLQPLSFDLAPGRVLGIVGPNGAGKTTLLRLLYRFHRPVTGTVAVDGVDLWSLSAKAAAQRIAVVLQEQPSDFALTVRDIVALGRTPHRQGFGGGAGARDAEVIEGALDRLDLHTLAGRTLGSLSGGERQRVLVARALAQEPRLLILDEPTNHLDIRHQLEILDLIRSLPLTIVTSLHDLNLTAGACDEVLLLRRGQMVAYGAPSHVLSEDAVSETFRVLARRERLMPSHADHLTFHLSDQRT